jgi:hypothetical protein
VVKINLRLWIRKCLGKNEKCSMYVFSLSEDLVTWWTSYLIPIIPATLESWYYRYSSGETWFKASLGKKVSEKPSQQISRVWW